MLTKLTIENYALIKKLEINPSHAFNIITGETGAGKSIVLGALSLLLGKRAEGLKHLYNKEKKCVLEGEFEIKAYRLKPFFKKHDLEYEELCIVRRELSPYGKSRTFVNDSPVTLEIMRKLGVKLIDIHSQHDTMQLSSNKFQLGIIDDYAENSKLRDQYKETFLSYKTALNTYNELKNRAIEIRKESDYNRFLYEELNNLKLEPEEQVKAEKELKLLEKAEELKQKFTLCSDILGDDNPSVLDSLKLICNHLSDLQQYSEEYETYYQRANSCFLELEDLAGELSNQSTSIEYEPSLISEISERLSKIYQLQQKHQVNSLEELLNIQEELEKKLNQLESLDEDLAEAEKALLVKKESMEAIAKELSDSRTHIFAKLCDELKSLLSFLGMENSSLSIYHTLIEPTETGVDEISLLFTANKGLSPQILKNVASGGEFSRLMFSIKYILAGKTALPTIIFDEIDTGISGEIALKMVKMMEKMAKKHQLIVITHLPQIASRGDQHYFVYKDHSEEKTSSNIRLLNQEDRILEVATMIGGNNPSQKAKESARELFATK